MGMSVGGSGAMNAEPNVVPMIDILLVLLIIFMVSQPLSRMTMAVQVPPEEKAQATVTKSDQIVLVLNADGSYAINSQPVPKSQLDTQLHAIYDERP
jgi:biopolymer transport protein TolR